MPFCYAFESVSRIIKTISSIIRIEPSFNINFADKENPAFETCVNFDGAVPGTEGKYMIPFFADGAVTRTATLFLSQNINLMLHTAARLLVQPTRLETTHDQPFYALYDFYMFISNVYARLFSDK